MQRVLLLNGPNLNMLGRREPHIYGTQSLQDIVQPLQKRASEQGCELSHLQSNQEGALVSRVQEAAEDGTDALIVNAGAYTHTSIALRDALAGTKLPFVELHLSNTFARETFRHRSYLADIAVGVICGFGAHGYDLALRAIIHHLGNN